MKISAFLFDKENKLTYNTPNNNDRGAARKSTLWRGIAEVRERDCRRRAGSGGKRLLGLM